jgi:hypothetical protein
MTGAAAAGLFIIGLIVIASLIYGVYVVGWLRWFDK